VYIILYIYVFINKRQNNKSVLFSSDFQGLYLTYYYAILTLTFQCILDVSYDSEDLYHSLLLNW